MKSVQIAHRRRKKVIREFLQNSYGDEELSILLAHLQSGKFKYYSCCCFIGIATIKQADHAVGLRKLVKNYRIGEVPKHFELACLLPLAPIVNVAVLGLAGEEINAGSDKKRSRILIPMVRAEIRRRDRLVQSKQVEEASVPTYGG